MRLKKLKRILHEKVRTTLNEELVKKEVCKELNSSTLFYMLYYRIFEHWQILYME